MKINENNIWECLVLDTGLTYFQIWACEVLEGKEFDEALQYVRDVCKRLPDWVHCYDYTKWEAWRLATLDSAGRRLAEDIWKGDVDVTL